MNAVYTILLIAVLIPLSYLLLIAVASIRSARQVRTDSGQPATRFIIAIPAHDEENVIAATVTRLRGQEYPAQLFQVHIVADHCSDRTALVAREAGAVVHERNEAPRSGKGAALSWLFARLLSQDACDAVVVFDADTRVHPEFLRVMDAMLANGSQVVQGQHIISNPEAGWFPALTWAMFIVDNRYSNLGRNNLGWSAKNMGDSICFKAEVLRKLGWGEGLTEDYQLRQKLLLDGTKIHYTPYAQGFGEAPDTWAQAGAQRARWLRGTVDASQQFKYRLLTEGLKRRNGAQLDGGLQAIFPSYSTLTLISVAILLSYLLASLAFSLAGSPIFSWNVFATWCVLLLILILYPLFGLALEKAPLRAYLVMLSGPLFVIWRTWLAIHSRFVRGQVSWVRTPHGTQKP